MESTPNFTAILDGAQIGDRDSITALWRAHQPSLVGWLRSFDQQTAEDVASDAWIEALRNLDRFTGDEKGFRSWLFTIARRRLIDRQRRDQKRTTLTETLTPSSSTDDDASTQALMAIDSQQATAMIKSLLPEVQAEIVLLRVLGGLDAAQVAEVIGKKPGTVRVLQHRALRRLAEVLGSGILPQNPINSEEV